MNGVKGEAISHCKQVTDARFSWLPGRCTGFLCGGVLLSEALGSIIKGNRPPIEQKLLKGGLWAS